MVKNRNRLRLATLFVSCMFVLSFLALFNNEEVQAVPKSVVSVDPRFQAKVDAYINPIVSNHEFNGAILVAKGGRILASKGYGMANFEKNIPNTPQTMFRIGSLSKQFTAMAIMQLQEKGLLNVDDYVSKYLPDYPNGDRITIHQLLNHTSGVFDYTALPEFPTQIISTYHTPEQLVALFKDEPLNFEPGSAFAYSNSNYVLLGVIIEKISGQSYEAFLKENIFDKLHMENSGYDHNQTFDANHAAPYDIEGDVAHPINYVDVSVAYSAGALYSSAEDLYKWARAQNTEKLVSSASLERMITPSAVYPYGYGWIIVPYKGHQRVFHGGGIDGFASVLFRYPEDDTIIIILTNGLMESEMGSLYGIGRQLADMVFEYRED